MSTPNPDPKRWWALSALSLAVALVSVDNTILALAIPSLTETLAPTPAELLWIGDIYSFVLAGLLVTMGNVGDRIGRKKLLFIGLVGFAVLSVVAAFSPTAQSLILSRALLGVAGATLMPSTLSLIRTTFTEAKERTFAIGVWSAAAALGAGLGPVLGGLLLEHYWWGSVFLINVPIVVALLIIGAFSLRESRNPNPGPIDLLSIGLSLVGILAFISGVKGVAISGSTRIDSWVLLVVGIGLLWLFVRRQLHLESPLIDIRLFRIPAFSGAVVSNLVSVFGLMGVYFFLAQQFQLVNGDSPLQSGFQLLPAGIASLTGSLVATKVILRWGRRICISGGIAIGSLGLLFLGLIHFDGLILVTFAIVLVGFGFGSSLTGAADAILTSAPPERAGAASAVSETAFELGAALGIAILGTLLGTLYRANVEVPAGLTPEAEGALTDSLASAVHVAGSLPSAMAEAVLVASRVAFTDAFSITVIIAAIICGTGATIAFKVLPNKANEPVAVGDH